MATAPDSDPQPTASGGASRSWTERVARARDAEPPAVDVCAAVRAAIAREAAPLETDVWGEFARMFAAPRVIVSGAAGLCAALPLALWVFATGFARLDAFSRVLVIGGLPRWLVALVT